MRLIVLLFSALIAYNAASQSRQITVQVHRNLETVNALTIPLFTEMLQDSLADPWMYRNTGLMRMAYNYFKPYYQQPVLEHARQLIGKLGTGIYLLALYYEDFPAVKQRTPIPQIIWREVHADKDSALQQIHAFMQMASAFYTNAHVAAFQKQHRHVYETALAEVKKNMPGPQFITALEKYYGAAKGGYHIIVMPFYKSQWGMGWELDSRKGKEIFNIAAPFEEQKIQNGKLLTAGYNNRNAVTNLSVHEFGHSFVNTLTATEPFASQVQAYDSLFVPIKSDPQYSNWPTVFNEYVVRAGEVLIMQQMGEQAFAAATKSKYKDWVYLDHFVAQMQWYLNHRKEYASFEKFLPTLIQSLAAVKKPAVQ